MSTNAELTHTANLPSLVERYPWLIEVFITIFVTLLVSYLAKIFFHRVEKRISQTANLWDDAIVFSVSKPMTWMIFVVGFYWALHIIRRSSEIALFEAIDPLRNVITVGIFAWFLVRAIGQLEKNLVSPKYDQSPFDETTAAAISKLARITVIITAVLVAVQTLGYSISGVLAFGGIGGIAVGFAAKDILANFFGGLMIYLDRPFAVGDWVRSNDKEIEGTVEDIGWRLTRIRTFDKRPLYVPNSTFTQIAVENPSRMLNRRIYETIGLRYDDAAQVERIVVDIKNMLKIHKDIDHDQTLIVNFDAFSPSSLDIFIYTFTKTTNWVEFHEIKQDVLMRVLGIIHEVGADVAFPTHTVKLDELEGRAASEAEALER